MKQIRVYKAQLCGKYHRFKILICPADSPAKRANFKQFQLVVSFSTQKGPQAVHAADGLDQKIAHVDITWCWQARMQLGNVVGRNGTKKITAGR